MTIASSRLSISHLVIAAAALSAMTLGTASTAGAIMGCGQYSFGFDGTRLLNDGTSATAGPFSVDLLAGTYDVITQSHDDHPGHPGQIDQTEEQWYFVLDSGYTSPLTTDIPEDNSLTVDEFDGQFIGATTSITLHHRGIGSVNSVDPICVGFTPSAQIAGPVITAPAVDVAVQPELEVAAASPVLPQAVVDTAPASAQLALTGPSARTTAIVVAGLSLLGLGTALVRQERRKALR